MKKILFSLFVLAGLSLTATAQTKEKMESFGEPIEVDGAIAVSELRLLVDQGKNENLKVEGTVASVCQKKGCWVTMELGNGESMMVRFKDYEFFLPKDCTGKRVVMAGNAQMKKTSVDELRHYAQDAGKSKEEIEQIREPKEELSFEAYGVLLFNE